MEHQEYNAIQEKINLGVGAAEVGEKQYLTFLMAGEEYGVDILSVQEIRGWDKTTAIPNAPEFVNGVMNLRGAIVPVIDLRLRFNLEQIEYGPVTVVIVVKVELEEGEKIIGLVVDAVSDVYTVNELEARQAPEVGENENREFVKGLINIEEKLVVLLDLKPVLTYQF